MGFYNSFTARCDTSAAAELAAHGIEVSRDGESGELHALPGAGLRLGAVPTRSRC
ncbi:chorismate-binding protein [Streptomyces californicus]